MTENSEIDADIPVLDVKQMSADLLMQMISKEWHRKFMTHSQRLDFSLLWTMAYLKIWCVVMNWIDPETIYKK